MVKLQEQDIREFARIYENVYGIQLAPADARVMATKLMRLMELILKP